MSKSGLKIDGETNSWYLEKPLTCKHQQDAYLLWSLYTCDIYVYDDSGMKLIPCSIINSTFSASNMEITKNHSSTRAMSFQLLTFDQKILYV